MSCAHEHQSHSHAGGDGHDHHHHDDDDHLLIEGPQDYIYGDIDRDGVSALNEQERVRVHLRLPRVYPREMRGEC